MNLPRSHGSRVYLALLLVVAGGLAAVALGHWRGGVVAIGAAFIAGATARIVVTEEHTGMLRVRGKVFDVAWMVVLGVSLIVLAIVVPPQV